MKWQDVAFETLYASPSRNGVYKPKEFHGSGCRIVNMGELFGFDIISDQNMSRIEMTEAELVTNALEDGDLLFGRRSLVEAGAGKCSIVVNPPEPLTFESSIIRVRVNRDVVNPRFIYYYFASPQGKGRIRSIVSGTNVKGIRSSDLRQLAIAQPPKDIQDAIADILSAYDGLIENNRRRMVLLEDAARQLYREWFVRLRFPGYEHTRIIKGVPEGWRTEKLGNLLAKIESKKKIPKDSYLTEGPIPCVDQSAEFIGGFTEDEDAVYSQPLPAIVFGDHTRVLKLVNFAFARGADGTQIIYPNTRQISSEYLYLALKEIDLSNYFYARHFKFLKEKEVFLPEPSIVQEFTDFARPCFEQVQTLRLQIQKLRSARDLMLPRLMNGEIAV
jgi:type I restriction enzyme, S subunit